jgi:hypothetical protein
MARAVLLLLALALGACSRGERELVLSADEGSAAAARALVTTLRDRAQLMPVAETTSGDTESLQRLRDGRADLVLATADVLAEAVNGQGAFRGETVPARTICRLGDSYLHVIVSRNSPVAGLSSLRGRKVSTGQSGSATELTALRVLREALLDPERDVSRVSLPLGESLVQLREGRLDAIFWTGTVPAPALTDAAREAAQALRLVSAASVVPLLQKRFGESLYWAGEFPPGAYGSSEPAASVVTGHILVARADLPDAVAFAVAKTVVEASVALASVHPLFREIGLPELDRPSPAAVHPGAARYFRESRR